ncbi:MAG: NAD-dependent epimerase/dehydratase family protein, partial [Melioribacteraceae bacterium]|nr:NAD-dependent epimerase/dehydratase family protein [Melioribacteraceae bacterium]
MNKRIRVGITSIGSGVGQSIIDSCNLSKLPIYTIGLGANPMAYGQYDCNIYDILPSIYSKDYIDCLLALCIKHKIDVLIPGLDDELLKIARNVDKFLNVGVTPIVGSIQMIELCRDKVEMSRVLSQFTSSFVNSYDKQSLMDEYKIKNIRFPLIAKPRDGYASRGLIIINSEDDFPLIDDNHVIQELAVPHSKDMNYIDYMNNLEKGVISQVSEVSVQFVIGIDGRIIGKCATFNKLNNGVPIEVIPFEDSIMWEDLEKIIPYLLEIGLKGPINIQGRMTDNGPKWFEMNARFTGITGLRAMMGFNEVEALIKDFLNLSPKSKILKINNKRLGIRQVTNRVIEFGRNIKLDDLAKNSGYYHWDTMGKTIMVTGSTGFLGYYLVKKLTERVDVETVICFARNRERAINMFKENTKVRVITNEDIKEGCFNLGLVDILIHAAFALISDGVKAIAESLEFTSWIFNNASNHQVPRIINISSQSVYGSSTHPLWDEINTPPMPVTPYAMAKYSSELMLSNINENKKQTYSTSIRLTRIFGYGIRSNELPYKFMKSAFEGSDITIQNGTQTLDLLDVNDAVEGIVGLLDIKPSKWEKVYNLGS